MEQIEKKNPNHQKTKEAQKQPLYTAFMTKVLVTAPCLLPILKRPPLSSLHFALFFLRMPPLPAFHHRLRHVRAVKKKREPCYMGVSLNGGFPPKSSHLNRVFHCFHHPYWGFPPIFGNPICQLYWLDFSRGSSGHRLMSALWRYC